MNLTHQSRNINATIGRHQHYRLKQAYKNIRNTTRGDAALTAAVT